MLPDLPSLDFASEESLHVSSEARASAALHAADGPLVFKGLELRLTVSIKSLFFMLMRLDGVAENGGDRTERDAIILLYLATQPSWKWSDPITEGGKLLHPLRTRPSDWLREIDAWADQTIGCEDLDETVRIIDQLWLINHATRPELDGEEAGEGAQKKTQPQSGK